MTTMLRSGPTIRSRLVTDPRLSLINSPTAGHADRSLRIVARGRTKIENAPISPATWRWRLSANRSRGVGGGAGVHAGPLSVTRSALASRRAPTVANPAAAEAPRVEPAMDERVCGHPNRNRAHRPRAAHPAHDGVGTGAVEIAGPGADALLSQRERSRSGKVHLHRTGFRHQVPPGSRSPGATADPATT